MELILDKDPKYCRGMQLAHDMMCKLFGRTVSLVTYWGPVQMCVYYLEYDYIPDQYKILIECERGVIVISVEDQKGSYFCPSMLYPEAEYAHYEDVEKDIVQLVSLTHQALESGKIVFQPYSAGYQPTPREDPMAKYRRD